jgi:hypothetical protein
MAIHAAMMRDETRSSRKLQSSMQFLGTMLLILVAFAMLFGSERMFFILPSLTDLSASRSISRNSSATEPTSSDTPYEGNADFDPPAVAWLMTYPNSGTTYTLKLIQQYTNTTTATNYGFEQSTTRDSIPIDGSLTDGPFWRYPDQDAPPRFVITKTHCGGNCMCAKPEEYVETQRSFEIACRSGSKTINQSRFDTTYAASIPKRAVHLFRNPYDNLVARLHLEQRKWTRKNETEKLEVFTATKEGFHEWCRYLDLKSKKTEFSSHFYDDEMLAITKALPCHAEIIRYTWWHELAMETVRRMGLPLHNLYYENYTENLEGTVDELFDFLHLSPAEGAEPAEFITGKHYADYYDAIHLSLAKDLVSMLASKELWLLIRHYFDGV